MPGWTATVLFGHLWSPRFRLFAAAMVVVRLRPDLIRLRPDKIRLRGDRACFGRVAGPLPYPSRGLRGRISTNHAAGKAEAGTVRVPFVRLSTS